jgi:Na+-transporting NADH:ubiquinone oxidoreductase subunit NqrB
MEQSILGFWDRFNRGDRLPYLTKSISGLLPADGRIYQILFLSIFLGVGVIARDWSLSWSRVGITLSACGFFQVLFTLVDRRFNSRSTSAHFSFSVILSALVTGLSLSLLLRANSDLVMIFAAFMAIASKFIFRFNQKHWFNPANFGIVSALLFGSAWISPGQWGHDLWLVLIFAGLGFAVLGKVGRWDTSVAFFASYAALEGIRNFYLGWTMDVLLHRLSSGSLLLFALFMITDPRSTPNARLGRIFWAILVGIVSFIFQNYLFISAAPFWALFVCAPLSVIFDRMFVASRFSWLTKRSLPQVSLN